jgi:hypothetical protein
MRSKLAALCLTLLAPPLLADGGRGQGAIVVRDDTPVYADSKGDKIEWKLKRGDAVAGYMAQMLHVTWQLDEVDGRVHVFYFKATEQKGSFVDRTAWMDPKDLSRFTYDGSCGPKAAPGGPYSVKGFGSKQWNPCFEEARDTKLDALRPLWAQADAAVKAASAPPSAPAPATSEPAASTSAPAPATK